MKKVMMDLVLSGLVLTFLTGCGSDSSDSDDITVPVTVPEVCNEFTPTRSETIDNIEMKSVLGKQLFSDKNLSFDRSQSCATCHNPSKGFIDDRTNKASINAAAAAGSLGDNGTSIGDRNAPTAAYAAFSPHFKCGTRARVASQQTSGITDYEGFIGGQFWDGREASLKGQAGGPPTNPDEMNMPNKSSVVERIKENASYISEFESLYGVDIFDDVDLAYSAMSESIAAFESFDAAAFYPFDSKYDRSLLDQNNENYYDYDLLKAAARGKARFFSSDLTCAACHQLRPIGDKGEIFTSFEYHNIGVPENKALRIHNEVTELDHGLLNNAAVTKGREKGKFKVPTLRNIAVTAPYMHNGVFNELETVIKFYQHAKLRAQHQAGNADEILNPETGLVWADAEINENVEDDLLGGNDINLDADEVEAMVCFLISLTDKRYEHLLDQHKVSACGL